MSTLVFSLTYAALAFVLFLAAKTVDKRLTVALAAICAIYLGLDDLVTGLASSNHVFAFIHGNWNWTGKIYSILLSTITMLALRIHPDDIGLRLKQNSPKLALVAVVGFIIWGACLGLLFHPGAPDAETLAFQASMPGISEELAYRGIAPAILMGLILGKHRSDRMPWAVIVATAVLFGIWHSLSYADGKFGFDLMSGLFPIIGSVVGGWLRFKTGSLVVPLLGHSLANLAFHLAGGMAA
ncbi:MAG: CPBP family intramembrane glutamic endopeptidase [Candidatus Aminicenantales bacterium]